MQKYFPCITKLNKAGPHAGSVNTECRCNKRDVTVIT